jgi:hypothetical protein
MTTLRRSLFHLACVLCAVLPAMSQKIPAEQWQQLSSTNGGFTVWLPGEPQESSGERSDPVFGIEGVKSYGASVGLDQGMFSMTARVYPHSLGGPEDAPFVFERF